MTQTLFADTFDTRAVLGHHLAVILRSPSRWLRPVAVQFFTGYFDGDFPRNGRKVFDNHYHMVRALVPKENLLEFRVQDGWEPLCSFLGCDIPGTAFPAGNTTAEVQEKTRQIVRRELVRAMKILPFLALGLIVAVCYGQLLISHLGLDNVARMYS